jgi:glycosyltransferase involved in cell wall biosynthesis
MLTFLILILIVTLWTGMFYHMWPFHRRKRGKLSVLIPFTSQDLHRIRTVTWVKEFYETHLPRGTEFIIGTNYDQPFCKTAAVNQAASKATGDIIVILDADCYMDPNDLVDAAERIRSAQARGIKTWFVPYRRFYRLREDISDELLRSDPCRPLVIPDPPPASYIEVNRNTNISAGHWWGALVQIMPLEAFRAAGGMDERFKGWGGEDISFMHAVDTLWGKHKTTNNPVYHIWHPTKPGRWKGTRMWDGQEVPEMNDWLVDKYEEAKYDHDAMKRLTR